MSTFLRILEAMGTLERRGTLMSMCMPLVDRLDCIHEFLEEPSSPAYSWFLSIKMYHGTAPLPIVGVVVLLTTPQWGLSSGEIYDCLRKRSGSLCNS